VLKYKPDIILLLSHLLVRAGATDTAKQSVHHLDYADDSLQASCHQQSGEECHVEFNYILWNLTPFPYFFVAQVAASAKKDKNK